ncbi:MAG: NfeD family protein [Oscillospiraceae bacterium]|nr:NfeD family protein [Oscillospiraceae bacterium]
MNFVWFGLLVAFIAIEAGTVSMVSAWFALGALAALITELTGAPVGFQVFAFLAVSAVALAMLRPIAKKHFNPRITRTNVDALAGRTCLCVTAIDNLASQGQVKLGDVEWSARSTNGEPIPAGTQVKIDRVEGVKVYVTPIMAEVK